MILTSPLLCALPSVRHAFSTRLGGLSRDEMATMSFLREPAASAGAAEIARNRSRLLALAALPESAQLVEVEQVHGARVLEVDAPFPAGASEEADGMFTGKGELALGVRTADCAPILIAATGSGARVEAVAAVHAGWRGATAGILAACVASLEKKGANLGALRVAIGPTIGLASFEVGDEVIAAAERSLDGAPAPAARGPRGKWHLDLRELLVAQLLRLGASKEQIDRVGGCTVEAPALYFSHRRDAGRTGRHLSLIAIA